MSSTTRKVIKITPELFKVNIKKKKNTASSTVKVPSINKDTLRRNLLKRLNKKRSAHIENIIEENTQTQKQNEKYENQPFRNHSIEQIGENIEPNELQTSFEYLSSLSSNPENNLYSPFKKKNTNTLKNYNIDKDVPYGCLKGGIKPSYRNWVKTKKSKPDISTYTNNQQLKEHINTIKSNTISNQYISPINDNLTTEEKLKAIKEKLKLSKKKKSQNYSSTNNIGSGLLDLNNFLNENNEEPLKQLVYETTEPFIIKRDNDINNNINITHNNENAPNLNTQTTPENLQISLEQEINKQPIIDDPKYILPVTKTIKKNIKRTYKLGKNKNGKNISILIKNNKTLKKIRNAHDDLKKVSIETVIKYLREHGFIKKGSNCPHSYLRKMYETSILSGDVFNDDKTVYLENMLD